jgi:pimeloyl-ACP methyl ester carboxylesterase
MEAACQFGPNRQLVGVLTSPRRADDGRPALILISAGLLHKPGPHRLYTLLARRLATLGFRVLRFDLAGIGDSGQRASARLLQEGAQADIRAAMDHLREVHGVERFVLGGLCSGAEDAFRLAVLDERVVGTLLIDAHAYPTTRHKLHDVVYRLTRRSLRIAGWYANVAGAKHQVPPEAQIGYRDFLPREQAAQNLQSLLQRGVQVHYIYTGGANSYFNHVTQFRSMFADVKLIDRAVVHHFPRFDHTIILECDRMSLIGTISDWMVASFSALSAAGQRDGAEDQTADNSKSAAY